MCIKFDYGKLTGRIKDIYGTQANFAKEVALSERTISLKLNSKVPFTDIEIVKWCNMLQISITEVDAYFFVQRVQKV